MWRNMEMLSFFLLFFLVYRISAKDVIYQLDDEDYYRMPPKNLLDRYEPCVGVRGGVYCTAKVDLVADQPSDLLDMIHAYSAHHEKNFNYSNIIYGVCVTKTCKQFYDGDKSDPALWKTTEACINESLSKEYGLKARVFDLFCYHHGMSLPKDYVDWLVAALLATILALNLVGSLYDGLVRKEGQTGNSILMSFSILANWKRLVAPPSNDPHQVVLRPLNGIRVMTSMFVILGHVPIPSVVSVENPTWFESAYRITLYHILYQGHIITLTFFFLSGFLLIYNVQLKSEKRNLNWKILPKAVLSRWLRLTPVNVIVLLLTVSWLRHTGFGPFWWLAVGQEWQDCRRYWVYNLFYVNNMIDHSTCNLQTWSLASDMQLHVIGLALALVAKTTRARVWSLIILYSFGVLWPAYIIYTKDLDGTLLATPSTISTFFLTSDAFNYVYKRTYSNLPCFVMGMAFGYYVYDLHKNNRIKGDYTRYWPLYYCVVALVPTVITTAYFLFFQDGPRASMTTRLLFAPLIKPLFGFVILLVILGAIYRVDNLVRGILSWDFWAVLSRVSYCMYTTHVMLVRYLGGTTHTLSYFSLFHMIQQYSGTVVMTILVATILHLTVESPFAGLIKAITEPKPAKPITTNGVGATTNGTTATTNGVKKATINGVTVTTNGVNKATTNGVHKSTSIKQD